MSKINWLEKLKWNDEHIEDLRYTGYSYIRQGKYDIALPFFEALLILDKDNVYDAQTLGAVYMELNKPQKALIYFDKALKLDPKDTPTLLNLTKTLFMMGKIDEGLKLANVLKNDPDKYVSNVAKALMLAYE